MLVLVLLLGSRLGDENPAACVTAHGRVIYGALGYDHYVELENTCARAFACTVSTNVNPTPIDVVVPDLGTVSVLTFRGSPAREFMPYVTCTPAK